MALHGTGEAVVKCPVVLDGGGCLHPRAARDSRPPCWRVARQEGGTMRTTSLLDCQGAVVVHRDQSVSCTDDTCPRDLPKALWFSLHSSFVRCSTALGGDGCLYCEFDAPVRSQTRRWQPEPS
jgi:hypothetical protein